MAFVEGDRFKHKFTGKLYKVKIIKDDTLILESVNRPLRCGLRKKVWNYFLRWQRKRG
jgi:hypothetical protein